jgi:3-hydroxymyristoyl/3-hydroxydecanoyl-(acyl carrier protein) dehydratase
MDAMADPPRSTLALLQNSAWQASRAISDLGLTNEEIEGLTQFFKAHAAFAEELARQMRGKLDLEGSLDSRSESAPLLESSLLDEAAKVAAESIKKAEPGSTEDDQLAELFENQAEFFISLYRWFNVPRGPSYSIRERSWANVDADHRPFVHYRLLDEVRIVEPGYAIAWKRVHHFECHESHEYDDKPMFGALLLESLGHAAVAAMGTPYGAPLPLPLEARVKFRGAAHADDVVELTCKAKRRLGEIYQVDGVAAVDDEPIVTVTFLFATNPANRAPAGTADHHL